MTSWIFQNQDIFKQEENLETNSFNPLRTSILQFSGLGDG